MGTLKTLHVSVTSTGEIENRATPLHLEPLPIQSYDPMLHFFLLQLLLCFTYMSQRRTGKGYPGDNTIIK